MVAAQILLALLLMQSAQEPISQPNGPSEECAVFDQSLENSLKGLAIASVRSDNQRFGEETALLLQIQINLQLMQAAGCQLPRQPISSAAYLAAALTCTNARLTQTLTAQRTGNTGKLPDLPVCDLSKWQRWRAAAGAETAEGESQDADVTLEIFNKVAEGMTYEEVALIAGSEGRYWPQGTREPGARAIVWENADGSYLLGIFKDGKLVSKSQAELK